MRRTRLARRRHPAGLTFLGAACLALAACSGASVGDVPYFEPTQPASLTPAAQKLCHEIGTAMQAVDGGNITATMTLAQARTQVDDLMQRGIASFTTLAGQAPKLRPTILQIVAYFRSFERSTARATSVQQILASIPRGSPAEQPAYQQLVSYISDNC
jgi:hypothetical protein